MTNKFLLLITLCLLLVGCHKAVVKPPLPPANQINVCSSLKFISVSDNDVLTQSTSDQIWGYDCMGASLGCWPYPKEGKKICEAPPKVK
jgi:hypothetical protein